MNEKIIICDCDHENIKIEEDIFGKYNKKFKLLKCKNQEDVISQCQDAEVIINQYVKLDEHAFKKLPNLKVIIRYGVGVDNINVEDATKYGIQVCNVPDYGLNEVADHAAALLLSLYRNIWILGNDTKKLNWDYSNGNKIKRAENLTVGIIGTGRIGRQFAKRIHAFNFKIIAFDKFYYDNTTENERPEYIEYVSSIDDLIKKSDFISLHCGLNEGNKHLVDKNFINKMKDGSYLINVSRGGLVNETDLFNALNSGKLAGAGLDTFTSEPIEHDNLLLTLDNCIITPHSAWYSEDAFNQLKKDCAMLAVEFLNGNLYKDQYKKNLVNSVY